MFHRHKNITVKRKDKPKVLLLGPLPPPYIGPAIATQILINSKLTEEFTLYHCNTNTHIDLNSIGKFEYCRVLKSMRLYMLFLHMIVKIRPNLVTIPISETTLGFLKDSIFMLLSKFSCRKTLLQLRGGNFQNWLKKANIGTRLYVYLTLKPMDGIIVLGNNLKRLFEEYFIDEKIFVVPNGANFDYQISNKKDNSNIRLLFLSNLLSAKGIEDVIRSLIFLKMTNNDAFELDVVGIWSERTTKHKCLALIKKYDLPAKFHNGVYDSSKGRFFNEADIFIFPPRESEGHPWVIVEAMAAGLPIIATDQGAIRECIGDGVNGFIVERKNPKQIAEKIKLLIENHELRVEMGRKSRLTYEEKFTESKMVARYITCFKRVIKS